MPMHRVATATDIPYSLRVSRRAKRARLRMSPHDGLIVVVPSHFDMRQVPGLVEQHRRWIETVQHAFDMKRLAGISDGGSSLPSRLDLSGIGESWRVAFRQEGVELGNAVREAGDDLLLLAGPVQDEGWCRQALELWLHRRASQRLVPQLERLAGIHGFSFARVSVRKLRSRWGSCSSKGAISLNLKLLFLPPLLVRYIMVHELCHLRHMNHSARFWSEVAGIDPDYAAHDRQMRHAWRYVPGWLVVTPGDDGVQRFS